MWKVAIGKILVLLFICWKIMKSYSSIKLTRSNPFCLYFMEKNNWVGGRKEKYFQELIGSLVVFKSPLLVL